jgi:hypothetical protein
MLGFDTTSKTARMEVLKKLTAKMEGQYNRHAETFLEYKTRKLYALVMTDVATYSARCELEVVNDRT